MHPGRLKIIPLDEKGYPAHINAPIKSRTDFVTLLVSASAKKQKVGIRNEEGQYISCGRKFNLGFDDRALASYHAHLEQSEQFEVEHIIEKGTFSFKSYNGLRMHYNKNLGNYLSFNTKDKGDNASWFVHPIGLSVDSTADEYINFAGVVGKDNKFLFHRVAEGVGQEWTTDFEVLVGYLIEDLQVGDATIFQNPATNHLWCVVRNNDESLSIILTSQYYPKGLAVECNDALSLILENYQNETRDKELEKLGLEKDQIVGKEMAGLMIDFNDQYIAYIQKRSHLSVIESDINELQTKMGENIERIQANITDTRQLVEQSEELIELSKQFKRQTSKLPTSFWGRNAVIITATGVGGGAGALAGWLIGGPGGTACLAQGGARIALSAVAGAGFLAATTTQVKSSFWSRKFVKFKLRGKRRRKMAKA